MLRQIYAVCVTAKLLHAAFLHLTYCQMQTCLSQAILLAEAG